MQGFERIGPATLESEVLISLDDAERLRSIGHNIILSSESAKHISESTISASLVVSNHLRLPAYLDDSISSLYGYVEDESYGDNSWRTLLKYHSYGVRDGGFLGFESEYVIDVLDDEVVLAKRSLYRRRDLKNVSVNKAEINVEIFERRTMADTALESRHVGRLEQRMKRLVSRAERS